jgi:hypothetical protein
MENTMNQTVGEQFLEWYNSYVKEHGCSPSDFDVNFFWTHNFLEKEKEQIMDAWDRGQYIGSSFPTNQIEVEFEKDSEHYYNETYNVNK